MAILFARDLCQQSSGGHPGNTQSYNFSAPRIHRHGDGQGFALGVFNGDEIIEVEGLNGRMILPVEGKFLSGDLPKEGKSSDHRFVGDTEDERGASEGNTRA